MMNVTRQRAKYTSRYFYNHDIIYLYTTAIYYESFQKRLLSDGFTLSRVVKFASQVLFSMWQHQELREVYRKSGGFSARFPIFSLELFSLGWKEADFVTKTVAARNARPNSPTHLNSTLNRPMASQGGTRSDIKQINYEKGEPTENLSGKRTNRPNIIIIPTITTN